MVEYDLAKVGVEGSNPFSRSVTLPENGIRGERSQALRLIKEQCQRVAELRRSEVETAESF